MPYISVHSKKQPDVNKKRQLVEKLTDVVVEVYGAPREVVLVEIWENDSENVARGGKLLVDLGH